MVLTKWRGAFPVIQKFLQLTLILLLGLAIPSVSHAAAWRWLNNNRFEVADYGVILERPGAQWRVVEAPYPLILEMVYHRGRGKIVMSVRELPPVRAVYAKGKRDYRLGDLRLSTLAKELISGHESAGMQFFEVRELDDNIYAAATDAERRLYFFHFHLVRRRDHRVPVVIEMGIPRELYHEFHPQFLECVRPLTDWSRVADSSGMME